MDKSLIIGESLKSEITNLLDLLENEKFSSKALTIKPLISFFEQIYFNISKDVYYPYEIFLLLKEAEEVFKNEDDPTKLWNVLRHRCIDGISTQLRESEAFVQQQKIKTSYNSEDFYKQQIATINEEKKALAEEIDELKKKQTEVSEESEEYKLNLQRKMVELNSYIQRIRQLEQEKEEQDKINDAITVWDSKIKDAFSNLKIYIKPLKYEHIRLGVLYWFYLALTIVLILWLGITEYRVCDKIIAYSGERLPTWQEYFSVILPIPISMVLLWGFIHEMNRAQRQLVILAKQIHEIEYVEGLLLTINQLSTNINESMIKVNEAINKLLENHLTYRDYKLTDEMQLKREERKDPKPHEETLKILKEINELITAYKK